MALYRYKAASAGGKVSVGVMEADSRAAVVAQLQAQGQIPIRAEEAGKSWFGLAQRVRTNAKPKLIAGLFRELETLLHAGLPLDRALDILKSQSTNESETRLIDDLLRRVRGGSSLSEAMMAEAVFPAFCTAIVRAGESGGTLDASLGELARQLERNLKSVERLQSALMYPAMVLCACVLSIVFLFTFIVPRFQAFFENVQAPLPLVTRAVMATGAFFQAYGWTLPILFVSGGWLLWRQLNDPKSRERLSARLLAVPVLGTLIAKSETGRFCRALGTLLKNGVTLIRGLEIAGETFRNPRLAKAVVEATRQVKEGKGLAEPLMRTQVFPPLALRLIRLGEEAARLDDMLMEVAEAYDREGERDVERLMAILGPAITIGLGALVALVIGSILMALLSVYQFTV